MGSVHTRIFIPLRRNDTFNSIGSLDFSISCYGVIIFLGVKILSASKTKWIAGIYHLFQDSMKRVLFSDGLWVETKILFDSKKNLSQTTGLSKEKNIIRKQKQIEHMFFLSVYDISMIFLRIFPRTTFIFLSFFYWVGLQEFWVHSNTVLSAPAHCKVHSRSDRALGHEKFSMIHGTWTMAA